MIFVYLYLGGFIAKSVLKFNWLSIPWTQIAPIFSAISALAACASVIVSIYMANRNRKFSEENNKNNLEVAKRNNEINVAAAKQNNFDNLFFKLTDLLDARISSIRRIDGKPFDPSDLVFQIKNDIRIMENKKAYINQLNCIRDNFEELVEKVIVIENLELARIVQNNGKNYACSSKSRNLIVDYVENNQDLEVCIKQNSSSPTYAEVIYLDMKYVRSNSFNFENPEKNINKYGILFGSIASNEEDTIIKNELDSFFSKFYEIMLHESEVTPADIMPIVKDNFTFIQFGSFFAIVNRIAKIIKEEYGDSIEKQNKYVGILRTQIPSLLLVCIYLNSEYMSEGEKLRDNLKDLELWGSKEELKNNIHINATMFYNAGKEIDNIIENYTRKVT